MSSSQGQRGSYNLSGSARRSWHDTCHHECTAVDERGHAAGAWGAKVTGRCRPPIFCCFPPPPLPVCCSASHSITLRAAIAAGTISVVQRARRSWHGDRASSLDYLAHDDRADPVVEQLGDALERGGLGLRIGGGGGRREDAPQEREERVRDMPRVEPLALARRRAVRRSRPGRDRSGAWSQRRSSSARGNARRVGHSTQQATPPRRLVARYNCNILTCSPSSRASSSTRRSSAAKCSTAAMSSPRFLVAIFLSPYLHRRRADETAATPRDETRRDETETTTRSKNGDADWKERDGTMRDAPPVRSTVARQPRQRRARGSVARDGTRRRAGEGGARVDLPAAAVAWRAHHTRSRYETDSLLRVVVLHVLRERVLRRAHASVTRRC